MKVVYIVRFTQNPLFHSCPSSATSLATFQSLEGKEKRIVLNLLTVIMLSLSFNPFCLSIFSILHKYLAFNVILMLLLSNKYVNDYQIKSLFYQCVKQMQ